MCVLMYFFSNLYLYNTVLSVLFCVNKDIIIRSSNWPVSYYNTSVNFKIYQVST